MLTQNILDECRLLVIGVIFREWREKFDQVDDVEQDTLEFTDRKTFLFSPEQTAPLTGDEELTLLHPLLTVRYFY